MLKFLSVCVKGSHGLKLWNNLLLKVIPLFETSALFVTAMQFSTPEPPLVNCTKQDGIWMGNPDNTTKICHCPEPMLYNFPEVHLTICLVIFIVLALVYAFCLFIIYKTLKEARNLKHGHGQRNESQEYRFPSMANSFDTIRRESAYMRRSNSTHGALVDLGREKLEDLYENIPKEYISTIQEESMEDLSAESEAKSTRDEDSEEHFYDNVLQLIYDTEKGRNSDSDEIDDTQITFSAKPHVPRRIGSLLRSAKEIPSVPTELKDEVDPKKAYMRSQSLSRKSVESFIDKFRKSSDPLTVPSSVPGSLKSHRSDSSKRRDQDSANGVEKKRRNTSNSSTLSAEVQGVDWTHRMSGILRNSSKGPSDSSYRRKRKLALSFQEPTNSPIVKPRRGSKRRNDEQESAL